MFQPGGNPDTIYHSIRRMPAFNTSSETVPPFALVMLTGQQRKVDDLAAWDIAKPDAASEERQEASMLAVNGPTAIPASSFGEISQDWPLPALAGPTVNPGNACGPKAGAWSVRDRSRASNQGGPEDLGTYKNWYAFQCVANNAQMNQADNKTWIRWIEPVLAPLSPARGMGWGNAASAGPGEVIAISSHGNLFGVETISEGYKVLDSGIYLIGFSMTVWAHENTPTLTRLESTVFSGATGLSTSRTPITAWRSHLVETDEYGHVRRVSQENIASSGILSLNANDVLRLKNTSGVVMYHSLPTFWLVRIGRRERSTDE